ncbi:spermatogenesis associated 2-like [Polyodon spathula]|uniref:spermatogenesis associated 2-like n=1 Tax=Polyodon spathula TaxID=7913 RepID=UPI001B7EC0D4|nr:spermatogenesis associated 2-like [Polyodon spathula]
MSRKDICKEYRKVLETCLEKGHADIICRDAALVAITRKLLIEAGKELHGYLENMFEIITDSLQQEPCLETGLEKLRKAFEILELASLNLYLSPWRQEFKIIKTYSGVYIHYLKPVLSDHNIVELFQKMGYRKRDKNQLEIAILPSSEDQLKLACGFFTARSECDLLLEVLKGLKGFNASIQLLIPERLTMKSLDEGVENLKKKILALKKQEQRDPWTKEAAESSEPALDLYTDPKQNRDEHHQSGSTGIFTSNVSFSITPLQNGRGGFSATSRSGIQSLEQQHTLGSSCPPGVPKSNQQANLNSAAHTLGKQHSSHTEQSKSGAGVNSAEMTTGNTNVGIPSNSPGADRSDAERTTIGKERDCLEGFENCTCVINYSVYKCKSCKMLHSCDCKVVDNCSVLGHEVIMFSCETRHRVHDRLNASTEVCQRLGHNTQSIHDKEGRKIMLKNVEEVKQHVKLYSWQKHSCISASTSHYCACVTCFELHSASCQEVRNCKLCEVITLKKCACSTELHSEGDVVCDIYDVCLYCHRAICKFSFYKNPLNCICGLPYRNN